MESDKIRFVEENTKYPTHPDVHAWTVKVMAPAVLGLVEKLPWQAVDVRVDSCTNRSVNLDVKSLRGLLQLLWCKSHFT